MKSVAVNVGIKQNYPSRKGGISQPGDFMPSSIKTTHSTRTMEASLLIQQKLRKTSENKTTHDIKKLRTNKTETHFLAIRPRTRRKQ